MIRLTTLGTFGKKQEAPKPVNEARTKMNFRAGDVEFVTQVNNGRLVLIPNSDGIDVLNDLKDRGNLSEEDVYSLMINRLYKKTKIHFQKDRSYRGAGYGFDMTLSAVSSYCRGKTKTQRFKYL